MSHRESQTSTVIYKCEIHGKHGTAKNMTLKVIKVQMRVSRTRMIPRRALLPIISSIPPSTPPSSLASSTWKENVACLFCTESERARDQKTDRASERDRLGDPRDRRRPTHSTEADDRPTDRRPTRGYFGFCNVGPKGRVEPQQK